MLEVVICEDNLIQRNNIRQQIENTILREKLDLNIALCTGSPDEVIEYMNTYNNTGIYLLDVDIIKKDEYVSIIIENNFFGETPKIHNIFKEGFSTKATNRGIGLFNVKEIIDKKYPNVLLNTSVDNNTFIQELWIKNNCGL